jgi:hypothetical protein
MLGDLRAQRTNPTPPSEHIPLARRRAFASQPIGAARPIIETERPDLAARRRDARSPRRGGRAPRLGLLKTRADRELGRALINCSHVRFAPEATRLLRQRNDAMSHVPTHAARQIGVHSINSSARPGRGQRNGNAGQVGMPSASRLRPVGRFARGTPTGRRDAERP